MKHKKMNNINWVKPNYWKEISNCNHNIIYFRKGFINFIVLYRVMDSQSENIMLYIKWSS